jgi:hypothetical protein
MTRNAVRVLAVAALAAGLAGAETLSAPDLDAARERGAAAVAPLVQRMQQALVAALAQGPAAAIDACRIEAPKIAAEISASGVRVGRTSHKLRNPANAPAPWMQPLLEAYLADPADRAPRAVDLGDGRIGYVEPIAVQPLCLACHGETLAPDVAARIDALYPADRARGFREGDLRGLVWAELPPAP